MMGMRSFPSQTVCVLQPQDPTTWLPTGNAGFLLWITLQKTKQHDRKKVFCHTKAFDTDDHAMLLQRLCDIGYYKSCLIESNV